MKRVPLIGCVLLVLYVAPARAVVLGPELLLNGSFEEPDIRPGTFFITTSIPGWTSTVGSGIEVQDNVAGSPFDGDQHVELDSFSSSNMFQDVTTQAGQLYHIEFAYSPRPGVNPNNIRATWNGSLLALLNDNGLGLPDTSWTVFEFDVLATGANTRLEFLDIGPSDRLGGYLDAVSVRQVQVPEPATVFVVGLGTLLLAGLRRRKAL